MFAREHKQEYDPSSSPLIERPLATGRPLSVKVQGNAYGGQGLEGLRKENLLENSKIPVYSPPKSPAKFNGLAGISNTPSKSQLSPGKSSLSSKSKYTQGPLLDPDNGSLSEDEEGAGDHELPPGKSLHRYAKSVTFDAAPPQINEYEMTTPDPSSVASGSREGSYESVEDGEDDSIDRISSLEREDSFDESLEDTDKTPVVLPEDWRFMSPANANDDLAVHMENPFDENESSPAPSARPSTAVDARSSPTRTDSANSNGERRPLPPLPALGFPVLSGVPSPKASQTQISDLDPDTPIPSLEAEPSLDHDEVSVFIKQEDDGEGHEVDLYSIPDLGSQHQQTESYLDAIEMRQIEAEPRRESSQNDDDSESHYSDYWEDEQAAPLSKGLTEDEGPSITQALGSIETQEQIESTQENIVSLPQFSSMLGEQAFGFGLESFLTPSPPVSDEPIKSSNPPTSSQIEIQMERPVTPEAQLEPPRWPGQWNDMDEEPRTPDSVIRHPVASSPLPDSPSVPEPIATIKAPGGKLKTRPSITPADIRTMAETRRQVSQEIPMVPPIPEKHHSRPSVMVESDTSVLDVQGQPSSQNETADNDSLKQTKRKSSLVQLEIPVGRNDGLGLGLDQEFDRVIEAQKVALNFPFPSSGAQPKSPGHAEYMAGQGFRPVPLNPANRPVRTQKGYLMRQNTKIIIASSASHDSATDTSEHGVRGTRSAGNSPRKPSQQHPWTTEPWNGKMRRKSLRQSGGSPQKKPASGPAPPLPGQQSNVANGLGSVTEDEVMLNSEETDDNGERGILFVKVVRVKDLDLPLPKGTVFCMFHVASELTMDVGERSYFSLTLDNGLHCVTTAWLELGKTAPIGQEFELIVLDDLEFQLTLQTKLEEPKVKPIVESPTKEIKTPKQSTFSRVFGSPRKRKELELKQQEEAQKAERKRQQDAQASRSSVQPTAWDLLHGLVAKDGSFARSYVCLKDHESKVYGRPLTVDVPCFNEWATEEAQTTTSVKSKRTNARGGTQRKAPYKIGMLELQLLFVPRPKGSKSEDMPKSMNSCIRELKEAEAATAKKWEGHLSQQGGDCPVGLHDE